MIGRWARGARLSLARLPTSVSGIARAPNYPVNSIRDLWPGDPDRGALLASGACLFEGKSIPLRAYDWDYADFPPEVRDWVRSFVWLRDLRALGSDEARLYARGIVSSWLDQPLVDPLILSAATTGMRLAAWLGHFDFFAASADEAFRQRLMDRILIEARLMSILFPLPTRGWRNFSALKGLLVVAVSIPSQTGFLQRFGRYLQQEIAHQILEDGSLIERNPSAQLEAAREFIEMSIIHRMARLPVPEEIQAALTKMLPALRAMRHGDGGLALFHGSREAGRRSVEQVLQTGPRMGRSAFQAKEGGFWRVSAGKALLFVDAAPLPPVGYDSGAHAAPLALEFSYGRQRLFVSCGSAAMGAWKQALRETAAHCSLVIEGTSCCDFSPTGALSRRPAHVQMHHQTLEGAHWLDGHHDGYYPGFGVTCQRRLYLSASGTDLRGEESIVGERLTDFALRFHLHPSVRAELTPDGQEILLNAGEDSWRFRQQGGTLHLEPSVYAGGLEVVPCVQIVVRPRREASWHEEDPVSTPEKMPEVDKGEDAPDEPGPSVVMGHENNKSGAAPVSYVRQVIHWVMEHVAA